MLVKIRSIFFNFIEYLFPYLAIVFYLIVKIMEYTPKLNPSYYCFLDLLIEKNFFTEGKVGMLLTVSIFIIGFYVTVMSVFGTNTSLAIIRLSENDLGKKFIRYSIEGIITTFISLITSIFFSNNFIILFIALLMFSLFSFIRFAIIVIVMYETNISQAKIHSDEEKEDLLEIKGILKKIARELELKKIESDEYFNKIKND